MSANYIRFMKKGKAGSPKDGDAGSRKRQRSVLSREGSPSGGSSRVYTVEDDPPHADAPPHDEVPQTDQTLFADGILLQPGELWATGVSERLRAVIRPPSRLLESSPLGSDLLTDFGRIEEEALKGISLIQSFKALHLGYESSTLKVSELTKEKSDLQLQLEEAAGLKEKLKKAEDDLLLARGGLTKAQDDLAKARDALADKEVVLTGKDATIAERDAALKKLQAEYNEALEMISGAAVDAFANAIAQAKVLNPGLVTDGMDVLCLVKDGTIVPGSPDRDDGEGGGDGEGEGEGEGDA